MYSFPKAQRLSRYSEVRTLFSEGVAFMQYPLSIRFVATEGKGDAKVLVSCPKRYLKRAVDRNRIKRLIRECYRTQNTQFKFFLTQNEIDVNFAIIYVSKKVISFDRMQKTIADMLVSLQKNVRTKYGISN